MILSDFYQDKDMTMATHMKSFLSHLILTVYCKTNIII